MQRVASSNCLRAQSARLSAYNQQYVVHVGC